MLQELDEIQTELQQVVSIQDPQEKARKEQELRQKLVSSLKQKQQEFANHIDSQVHSIDSFVNNTKKKLRVCIKCVAHAQLVSKSIAKKRRNDFFFFEQNVQ